EQRMKNTDVGSLHIASFHCGAEFGRYRGHSGHWSSPQQTKSIEEYAPQPGDRRAKAFYTTANLRSMASSTRSSSWLRRRINPVAVITLYMPCLRASRGSFSMR